MGVWFVGCPSTHVMAWGLSVTAFLDITDGGDLLHLAIYGVCRLNLLECGRSRSFSCHSKAVCLDFHILTYVYSCVHIWHCSLGSESPLGGLLYQCLLPWLSGALLFVQEELLRGSMVCGIQSGMNIKEKGRQMREQIILKFQLG